MNWGKNTELIHKYLDRNLSEEEKIEFQQKFNSDPEFAREVKIHTDAILAVKTSASLSVEKFLDEDKKNLQLIRRFRYPIAAILLALIGFTLLYYLYNYKTDLTAENIYSDYFQLPEDLVTIGTDGNLYHTSLYRSESEISQNNILRFNPSNIDRFSENPEQLFLAGLYFMYNQDFKTASLAFEKILEGTSQTFTEEATWYLGLSYIMSCRLEDANIQFEKLLYSEKFFKEKAREVLRKIKKIRQSC